MAKIFDKFKEYFQIFKQEVPIQAPQKTLTGYEATSYGYTNNTKKTEYLEEMRGWVGACVTAIADEIASINLRLYKVKDKDGSVEEVTNHPVIDLLYKVNNYTTKFDHFWLTEAYLKTTGESPWFIERGKNGKSVEAIYFLRPDKLTPIVGSERLIEGYKYQIGTTETITLPLSSIVLLKIPDPANPFRGLGAVQMAARTIDIDNFSEEWNKTFYENSASPASVLNVEVENLGEEQLKVLKASIRKEYEGAANAHKTMVLFGKMKLDKIGFNQKDMDFLEQQRFSRDKILGIFKVPKAVLAQTDEVNYASAKTAQYVFARWTIKPEIERITQQLNEFLLPMFPGTEGMFIDYDNPIPEDDAADILRYESGLTKGWMTINEVRGEEGLPDVEGGDSIYIPFSMVAIGSTNTENKTFYKELKIIGKKKGNKKDFSERIKQMKARNKLWSEIEDLKNDIRENVRDTITKQIEGKTEHIHNENCNHKDIPIIRTLTKEEKSAFWKKKDALTDKYLPDVKEGMAKVFNMQKDKVISTLREFKVFKIDPNTVYNAVKLNKKEEIKTTIELTLPALQDLFKESGDTAYELLGVDEEMDITLENIKKLLRENARKFSTVVTEYTDKRMKEIINESIAAGQSVDELKDKFRKFFNDSEKYRADRIARSETVRYNTTASEQAYIDSGIVEKKEWFVNPDACEFCIPMSGKTVPLGEAFFDKGDTTNGNQGGEMELDYDTVETPPLHPNCRCEIIPVFK